MDQERKSLRIGAAVIGCAVLLRLASGGFFQPLMDLLRQPELASFLLYMETGRVTRLYQSPEATEVWANESPVPEIAVDTEKIPTPVSFSEDDLELVELRSTCDYEPDLESLLLQPLDWELTGAEPTVLILHTHATESYTRANGEDYEESSDYRTLDENYNMLAIGDALAELLEAGGLTVIHDRTLHDEHSYNGSYTAARASVEKYLEQYPSIKLILDLHRDAADTESGQLTTSAVVGGQESAQLMLVVGSDGGGLYHPNWQENLSLALKLHVTLEKENPGICRYISFRNSRYNQDLLPGMLLVEVGAAGDTRQKALTATEVLAEGILTLAAGAVTTDSTS